MVGAVNRCNKIPFSDRFVIGLEQLFHRGCRVSSDGHRRVQHLEAPPREHQLSSVAEF